MSHKILVLHGPNLNLLGKREPEIYGSETLDQINEVLTNIASKNQILIDIFQSNSESHLIEKVHGSFQEGVNFLVINPGGLTHTSVALRDAISAIRIPFIEVHLSTIYSRESFRRKSFFSDLSIGVVCGFGSFGYEMAMEFATKKLRDAS